MRSIFFIVNPNADSGNAIKKWNLLKDFLYSNDILFEYKITERPKSAVDILKNVYQDLVVAVGGDGTINEVINGIVELNKDIDFTAFPLGTGNDWVRTYNLTNNISQFAQTIKNGTIKTQDIGKIEYGENLEQILYFNNMIGAGYSGEVVRNIKSNGIFSKGSFRYLIGAVSALANLHHYETELMIDDISDKPFITELNIAICKYGGGGMLFSPNAESNNGKLNITMIQKISTLNFIRRLPMLYSGEYIHLKEAKTAQCNTLLINSDNLVMQVDGELIGTYKARISVLPQRLKVLC